MKDESKTKKCSGSGKNQDGKKQLFKAIKQAKEEQHHSTYPLPLTCLTTLTLI